MQIVEETSAKTCVILVQDLHSYDNFDDNNKEQHKKTQTALYDNDAIYRTMIEDTY